MALLTLIPLVGRVWFSIDAGCLRGTLGPNRFGADPTGDDRFPAMRAAPF